MKVCIATTLNLNRTNIHYSLNIICTIPTKFSKSDNWLLFFLWLILLIKDNCNNGSNSTEKEKHKINKSYNIKLIPIPCFYSLFSCFFTTTYNTS